MDFAEFSARKSEFFGLLNDTRAIAAKTSFHALEGSCHELHDRLTRERFFVSVVGEIKRGKSSFINALLGREVLPKSSLICTAAICIIGYNDDPMVTLTFHDQTRLTIPPDQIALHVTRKNPAARTIAQVEIGFPLEILRCGVVLVDTPGVNDTEEWRIRLTEEFLPKSDGIIFMLNAGQPFSHSEALFLQDEVLRFNRQKLWFVVNGCDRLDTPAERDDAIEYCASHIRTLVSHPRVYPVSAKMALAAQASDNPVQLEESGVPTFLREFSTELIAERRRYLFDLPLGILESLLSETRQSLEFLQNHLESDSQKTEHLIARLKARQNDLSQSLERIVSRFFCCAEALVYETIAAFRQHPVSLSHEAIRLVLTGDETDEQKLARLAQLALSSSQAFLSGVVNDFQNRVHTAALPYWQEMQTLSRSFDSRIDQSLSSLVIPPRILPPIDLTIGFSHSPAQAISSFGRLSTLFFLLQGNLLLAGTAFVAALATSLRPSQTPQMTQQLQDRIQATNEQALDSLLTRRSELALECRKHIEHQSGELFRQTEHIVTSLEASHRHSATEITEQILDLRQALADLGTLQQHVTQFKQRITV